jgi:hypothetical protein
MRRKKAGVSSEEVQNGDIRERIAKVSFSVCTVRPSVVFGNFLFMSLEAKVCDAVKISCTCRMRGSDSRDDSFTRCKQILPGVYDFQKSVI